MQSSKVSLLRPLVECKMRERACQLACAKSHTHAVDRLTPLISTATLSLITKRKKFMEGCISLPEDSTAYTR